MKSVTAPTLALMALAGAVAILDGLVNNDVIVVALLAFPPMVTATRGSVAESVLVGVLCICLAALSGIWNDNFDDAQYLVRLVVVSAGAAAAVWIANLRLKLRFERDAADLLAETGLLLQEDIDAAERLDHIAQLGVPDLADAATVDLCSPTGEIVRSATACLDPELEQAFTEMRSRDPVDPDSAHPVAIAIRTGELVVQSDLPERTIEAFGEQRPGLELIKSTRPRGVMVVPLKARGSVLGALSLWILEPRRRHDRRAQNVATRLAHRVALALDNARLHEQQAHIAEVLQRALRPRSLPEITGFETASRFLTAGDDAYEVGGDFYDAFRTDPGTWTVVIGDVVGKGPEAAALTALARYTIRASSTPVSRPSEVLKSLAESIRADRPETRFCTAALARVSVSANGRDPARLTMALGGHPPPLVLRRDGTVDLIGELGTLLGGLPAPVVEDAEATLEPGESIVFYTDGMLESRDRRKADDPGWLASQLIDANGARAEELADQLLGLALKRQGGQPRDDIAILVLRRTGELLAPSTPPRAGRA